MNRVSGRDYLARSLERTHNEVVATAAIMENRAQLLVTVQSVLLTGVGLAVTSQKEISNSVERSGSTWLAVLATITLGASLILSLVTAWPRRKSIDDLSRLQKLFSDPRIYEIPTTEQGEAQIAQAVLADQDRNLLNAVDDLTRLNEFRGWLLRCALATEGVGLLAVLGIAWKVLEHNS